MSCCTELVARLRDSESTVRGATQSRIFAYFRWRKRYRMEWFPRIKSGELLYIHHDDTCFDSLLFETL